MRGYITCAHVDGTGPRTAIPLFSHYLQSQDAKQAVFSKVGKKLEMKSDVVKDISRRKTHNANCTGQRFNVPGSRFTDNKQHNVTGESW